MLKELKERRHAQWQGMFNIANRAFAESRDMTSAEASDWQRLNEEIDSLDERIATIKESERRREDTDTTIDNLTRAGRNHRSVLSTPANIPETELRAMRDAIRSGGNFRVQTRAVTGLTGGGDPISVAGTFAGAAYTDMPRVASLFPAQNTESATVRVYAASTAASAGVVSEGVAKGAAGLALTPQDVEMKKIATWQRMSYELTQDLMTFVGQIHNELTRAVVAAENTQLTSALTGNSSLGSLTASGDIGLDSTATAIGTLQASGIAPDAIVLSPGRLAAIRKATASGTGDYFVSPLQAGPTNLHGLPVTVTPELDDDVILVGAFAESGVVYLREPVSVRTGFNGSDFSENMVSVVAEERLALAVTQPAHIVSVDVSSS